MAIILVLDLLKGEVLEENHQRFHHCHPDVRDHGSALLAFVIWAGAAKLQYSDCTHSFPYSGSKSVCGEGGSAFALWNLFYLCFVSVGYFLVACMITQGKKQRKMKIKAEANFLIGKGLRLGIKIYSEV